MKRTQIILISIMFLTWLLPATAKTYRWVDENGVTIYSQAPPPSGDATIMKPPPKPAASPDEIMKDLKQRQDAIDKAKKKKATPNKEEIDAKNAEIKKENCEIARKNLADISLHPRVRIKMDDGSYKQLTDEERQAKIDKFTKDIEKFCN
ncbi:MAG: DUF4124 domain-containing protein [Gammaproteobacteria bacterium]|nr:DUF4124 domain-containing protein [Gammaproteobacteria bacterium]